MPRQGQQVSENNKLVCQGCEKVEIKATKFSKAGCKNYQKGSEALFHFQARLSQIFFAHNTSKSWNIVDARCDSRNFSKK